MEATELMTRARLEWDTRVSSPGAAVAVVEETNPTITEPARLGDHGAPDGSRMMGCFLSSITWGASRMRRI